MSTKPLNNQNVRQMHREGGSPAPIGTAPDDARSLIDILHDMKDEARSFVATRLTLLKTEWQEKLPNLKIAGLLAGGGALFVLTAYLLLTFALVALVAVLLRGNDYRWVFAFLSVGVLWVIGGGIALYLAKREFATHGLMPTRTIEVLKGDKTWMEREVKKKI